MLDTTWLTDRISKHPTADPFVLQFIYKFRSSVHDDSALVNSFKFDYSYYFAVMLNDAFKGTGHVCVSFPELMCAFVTYDGVAYNIHGVATTKGCFIPMCNLGDMLTTFRRSSGYEIVKNAIVLSVLRDYLKRAVDYADPKFDVLLWLLNVPTGARLSLGSYVYACCKAGEFDTVSPDVRDYVKDNPPEYVNRVISLEEWNE